MSSNQLSIKDIKNKCGGDLIVNNIQNTYNINSIGGDFNNAGRDININKVDNSNTDIIEILKELSDLLTKENLNEEDKDSALDCVELIQEQISAEEPKKHRIKNAWEKLISIVEKVPAIVSGVSKMKTALEAAQPQLQQLVSDLPRLPW